MNYYYQQFVKVLIVFLLLFSLDSTKANFSFFPNDTLKAKSVQTSNSQSDTVLSFVERMPEFPGGLDILARYIKSEIHYPSEAASKGLEGKVFVQFVVSKYGKILNPKIIKGIGGGCDEEAIRVINSLPDWEPGQQNGKAVNALFTLPITFKAPVEEPLMFVEKMPEFPGGSDAMMKFIYSHLVYPKEAKRKGLCGRVTLQFVVSADGKIKNSKILRGADSSLNQEAQRIVQSFPLWNPGRQNGKPVPVYFTLPIIFKLENCEKFSENKDEAKLKENPVPFSIINPDYKLPEFPGGNDSLNQFLIRNMKYPREAEERGIGGTVYLKMFVSKEGKIIDPKVIRGVCFSVDSEALRIVKLFPQLIPAKKKDISIELNDYSLEFTFQPNEKFINDNDNDTIADDDTLSVNEEPLTFVEQMPEFPGGQEAMMKFLYKNLKYPKFASNNGITGRVTLQFIIDETGKIDSVKVLRSLGGGCDEEAIRIVKLMPRWKPGKQNGKVVPVYFTLPIAFQMKE